VNLAALFPKNSLIIDTEELGKGTDINYEE
jgi:hypothetical protein